MVTRTYEDWLFAAGATAVRHNPDVRAAWLAGTDPGQWQYWPVVAGRKVTPVYPANAVVRTP